MAVCHVVLLPEFGGDLISYNNIDVPSSWMINFQNGLGKNLPLVHSVTNDINRCMGVKTPWLLDVKYRSTKGGIRYPKYELLSDGVHFTEQTAKCLVVQLLKDVDKFFEDEGKVVQVLFNSFTQSHYSNGACELLAQL